MPKSRKERDRVYYRRKCAQAASGSSLLWRPDFAAATAEFKKLFFDVEFGPVLHVIVSGLRMTCIFPRLAMLTHCVVWIALPKV